MIYANYLIKVAWVRSRSFRQSCCFITQSGRVLRLVSGRTNQQSGISIRRASGSVLRQVSGRTIQHSGVLILRVSGRWNRRVSGRVLRQFSGRLNREVVVRWNRHLELLKKYSRLQLSFIFEYIRKINLVIQLLNHFLVKILFELLWSSPCDQYHRNANKKGNILKILHERNAITIEWEMKQIRKISNW